MILARTKPSLFLPIIMFLWGCVTIAMAWVPNYQTLVGLRVIVGILEAGFAPGVLFILSSWYKTNEQSKRFGVYISAAILSGAFGGLIAGSITSNLDGAHGIPGWRWLFIVEGAATAGWSLVSSFLLLDFPANTARLSDRERALATKRLQWCNTARATTEEGRLGHLQALRQSLLNWRTWLFVVGYMAVVGSSTLSYFYPTLVEGLGYSKVLSQYMTIPVSNLPRTPFVPIYPPAPDNQLYKPHRPIKPTTRDSSNERKATLILFLQIYIVAFICTAISSVVMDKYPRQRGFALGCWMTLSMVCSVVTCAVYNFKARYALLVIMASGLWVSNALGLTYTSTTFSSLSNEVRGISLALVNAMGNLSQIYGAYLFPSADSPKYLMGFGVISGMCLTGVVSYFLLHVLLHRYAN